MKLKKIFAREDSINGAAATPDCTLRVTESVHRQLTTTVGRLAPETGMLLGGSREDYIVRHVFFDDTAERSGATYSPDVARLNRLLREWWNPAGISFLGFAHSHPNGYAALSPGDRRYAADILAAIPELDRLLLPIVSPGPEAVIWPYAVDRNSSEPVALELEVLSEDLRQPTSTLPPWRELRQATFQRVTGAYDLAHLRHCRVVIIGVGGAAGLAEDLVRAGVHDIVLVDPDTVCASNLATQQVYRQDLGRPKVEALAGRLRDINPAAEITGHQRDFTELGEEEIERLLGLDQPRPPIRTLLCGCTDRFFAQGRINRVGLHYGIPTLCAQVYAEGRGAEITFTYPGRTPACHRCILRSRYEAYLREGYANAVTSDGTPISSTTRLNATKFFVAMALLHEGTAHPRWGRMLERMGNRNLVQLRLDPDLELSVFGRVLGKDPERVFTDEAVWLPQTPECGGGARLACPDCGGAGDLRAAVGTISDTRLQG